MNSKVLNVFMFTAGAAIGAAVTWKLVKTKYEQLAREEIEAVRDYYKNREEKTKSEDTEDESDEDRSDDSDQTMKTYVETIKENGYANIEEKGEVDTVTINAPYVITPEEFGEYGDEYETLSLTYYADGVLTDEWDQVIDDVDDVIGLDSLTHFGEYEDDSVFVRDDDIKIDYEILLDERNFADIPKRAPRPRYVEEDDN